MFLKMLKSDLKRDRGLNVILFIFMIVSAAFVFMSATQVYTNITQESRTKEYCRSSDVIAIVNIQNLYMKEETERTKKYFDESKSITRYDLSESVVLANEYIDFEGFDESDKNSLFNFYESHLTVQPHDMNIVYGLDDKPVSPENGTIFVPVTIGDITGAQIGSKLSITTEYGTVFEFTIAGFTKDHIINYSGDARYIISDNDYAVIREEFPEKSLRFGLCIENFDSEDALIQLNSDLRKNEIYAYYVPTEVNTLSDDSIMSVIVSAFLVIISILIILIMLMTIRFTMIAALKNEEKEIGVMRAMGVDSLGFRWLFAAKYIFFAAVGGVIGLLLGIPLSSLVLTLFNTNYIAPEHGARLVIGGIAVVINVVMIFAFSIKVMRRIERISVVDAIHGENHGERFSKTSRISLGKRKKMSIPTFLSISDLLTRAKRYLFLVIAYSLSVLILLTVFNIRNTIISSDFMRYMFYYKCDYFIAFFEGDFTDDLYRRAHAENVNIYEIINSDFEKNGIKAEVDYGNTAEAELVDGDVQDLNVIFGIKHPEKIQYRKGSRAPELDNEVALSYYTAHRLGFSIGDEISFKLTKNGEDGISKYTEEEKFIITGFFDELEGGTFRAVLGGKHDDLTINYPEIAAFIINAEGNERDEVFAQIEELYGEENVLTTEEGIAMNMSGYDRLFMLLEWFFSIILLFVTVLITYLYMNVFISEEIPEIAILKSMGFTNGDVKRWQLTRMLLLGVISAAVGELLFHTLAAKSVEKLFGFLNMSGFGFLTEIPLTFIIIPTLFIGSIVLTAAFKVSSVKNIEVWNISEE